jgi:tRNA(adenine34) deaminase
VENILNDEYFMRIALAEAKMAFQEDEVPIGAVIVANGVVLAKTHNMVERLNDVTAHAEMLAFTAAADHLGGKYLKDCTLYVTLEPCVMCAGASYWTQITRVVFGAHDPKRGYKKLASGVLHPATQITGGLMEEECSSLLIEYFKGKR